MWRTSWSDRIERLDPERDHLEVHRLVCAHEFPWDTLLLDAVLEHGPDSEPGRQALRRVNGPDAGGRRVADATLDLSGPKPPGARHGAPAG